MSLERLQPTPPLVEAALSYAAKGWHVFALAKNGKIPLAGTHGLKDGTTDPILIGAMWANSPESNIGLRTGKESGIIIVDIDPRNNGNQSVDELQKKYGKLPATLLSRTPRGGIHRYYRHPRDGQSYGNAIELDKLSGIDVRGDDGYAVIPPSKINKLSYRFVKEDFPIASAPKWLLDLVKRSRTEERKIEPPIQPTGEKWLDEAVGRASEGNRNAVGFYLACQLRDDGLSESEARSILLAYASRVANGKTPYREAEALNSLKSAYRRPPRESARRR